MTFFREEVTNMWESPIKITEEITKQMDMVIENGIMKAIQRVGIDVNKEELLKALEYDRNQYEKGYQDGLNASKWMPCNPGDTVFAVISETGEIKEHKVSKVIFGKKHDQIVFNGATSFTIWGKNWDEYFNEVVFHTKEEALAKIKEGRLE